MQQRKIKKTYIIPLEVWMIFFNAVVKDGDDHPSAGVSVVPCRYNVHIKATGTILQLNIYYGSFNSMTVDINFVKQVVFRKDI